MTPISHIGTARYDELTNHGFTEDSRAGADITPEGVLPRIMRKRTTFNYDGTGSPILISAQRESDNMRFDVYVVSDDFLDLADIAGSPTLEEAMTRINNTICPFGIDPSFLRNDEYPK